MVTRFGSREICDVTFKATVNNQKVGNKEFKAGQPVFVIDTATASNMEQATTTVYAQGGKGYNRLIAWEGEKTMTFTVTDALMSPLGLAVLTGAGFAKEDAVKHIHVTYDVSLDAEGKGSITADQLQEELGLASDSTIEVCNDTKLVPYATILDHNGAIKGWADKVTLSGTPSETLENIIDVKDGQDLELLVQVLEGELLAPLANATVKLDFYIRMTTGATEITIKPQDFGGFFYVEADTLYRNQDGKDMAATLTFPRVKIQSGFTLSMAPTGDPSTFDFTMDAFPAYTYFDRANKVVVDITIVGGDSAEDSGVEHSHPVEHKPIEEPTVTVEAIKLATAPGDANNLECQANQDAIEVTSTADGYKVEIAGVASYTDPVSGDVVTASTADGLFAFTSTDPHQATRGDLEWLGFVLKTDENLLNVTWQGSALSQADIDEAAGLGYTDGKTIIFWMPYTDAPKTVTIGTVDGSKADKVIVFSK